MDKNIQTLLPSFVGTGTATGGGEEGGKPWKDVSGQGESKRSAQVLNRISRFFKKPILKLSLRFGGEIVLDKPLSQREEYLRQMKVLFYSYENEPLNCLEISTLSVKAKADQPEGGIQEAVAEPEG